MEFIDLKSQYNLIEDGLKKRLDSIMSSARFIMGAEVLELEEKLAAYVGVKHCISCANGTDALVMPLMAWGIGTGDSVLLPSFTFFSTAEAVSLLGATPVFVDSEPDTFNMDVALLKSAYAQAALNSATRPKAVISVDLFGQPAVNDAIEKFAKDHGLLFLEDAAQGFGGAIGGRRACSFGDAATTSFFPAKPLGCYGDGGAIFTNDDNLADVLRSIRVHGHGQEKYHNVRLGLNARLDTMQAAVLLEKLRLFDQETRRKNVIAVLYAELLAGAVTTPVVKEGCYSSWAQYTVMAKDDEERRKIQAYLEIRGIPTAVYYRTPLHKQPFYREGSSGKANLTTPILPVCENLAERVFSLPMHAYMSDEDVLYIANSIREALG